MKTLNIDKQAANRIEKLRTVAELSEKNLQVDLDEALRLVQDAKVKAPGEVALMTCPRPGANPRDH
eukprot:163870-Hanusia_phi.AAC.8